MRSSDILDGVGGSGWRVGLVGDRPPVPKLCLEGFAATRLGRLVGLGSITREKNQRVATSTAWFAGPVTSSLPWTAAGWGL